MNSSSVWCHGRPPTKAPDRPPTKAPDNARFACYFGGRSVARPLVRLGLLLLLPVAVLLGGCQSLSSPETQKLGSVPRNADGRTLADGSIRHDTDNARVAQLWSAAEQAKTAKNWDKAEQFIQEAIEIKPQDSVLWSRAADLKLTLLEPVLAEKFATRSIAYAQNNRTLLHRNWLIIEHARELQGDLLGVREAHNKVQTYQN